jgi:hypothetical protein
MGFSLNQAKVVSTPLDAVDASIRIIAPIMIGMSVLCFLCSFCWLSSALLFAQAFLWLKVTSSAGTLARAKGVSLTVAGNQCCGGTLADTKNLAIASLVFACLEILIGCTSLGFGAFSATNPSYLIGKSVNFNMADGYFGENFCNVN